MSHAAGEVTQTVSQKEKGGQTQGWGEREREGQGGRKRGNLQRDGKRERVSEEIREERGSEKEADEDGEGANAGSKEPCV